MFKRLLNVTLIAVIVATSMGTSRGHAQVADVVGQLKKSEDFHYALQLFLAIHVTKEPVGDTLRRFAKGPIEDSVLPSAFDAISASFRDAEARLKEKWPDTVLQPRLVSASHCLSIDDLEIDFWKRLEMDEDGVQLLLELLLHEYPAEATRNSLDALTKKGRLTRGNPAPLDEAEHTHPGLFLSHHWRIKKDIRPEECGVTVWLVYEVIQEDARVPVAGLETIKKEFVFDGKQWSVMPAEREEGDK